MSNVFALSVTQLMRKGLAVEALRSAADNVAQSPFDPRAHSTLAHTLMATGDYVGADNAAARAVALAGDEPAFHFLHARIRYVLADYSGGLDEAEAGRQYSQAAADSYYFESCSLLAAACLVAMDKPYNALERLNDVSETCVVRAGQPLTRGSVVTQANARLVGQKAI